MDVLVMQRDNERRACLEADQGPRVQWRTLLPGRSVRPPRLTRCATDVGRMDGSPRVREYTRKYAVVVTQFVTQLKGVPGYGTARQQDQGRGPR